MIDELKKDSRGSGRGLMELVSRNLSGRTERDMKKYY
jgi:hypothetical protein